MKYIVLVPDGMADEPIKELKGKTPLEAAHTPHMDRMAREGQFGLVKTIPDGFHPGSDIGNLALMGYEPSLSFTGRAPLEAASMGIFLDVDEVAFRCNLVTIIDGKMADYSAGHITTEESKNLIEDLARELNWPDVRFYPGKSYRHLMVVKTISVERLLKVVTTPPHDILNQPVKKHLPHGPQCEILLNLTEKSKNFLSRHQINQFRTDEGLNPANMIWLWGQGCQPELKTFREKYQLTGSVISAVDLVNGIGKLAGLKVIDVPGANGYYDTNYAGKAEYALASFKDHDFVYVHVEAPDEAGHNGDYKAKKECIEHFDKEVVGRVLTYCDKHKNVRVVVAPDHPTPVAKRTHTRAPVPFALFGKDIKASGAAAFSESEGVKKGLIYTSGKELMDALLGR